MLVRVPHTYKQSPSVDYYHQSSRLNNNVAIMISVSCIHQIFVHCPLLSPHVQYHSTADYLVLFICKSLTIPSSSLTFFSLTLANASLRCSNMHFVNQYACHSSVHICCVFFFF